MAELTMEKHSNRGWGSYGKWKCSDGAAGFTALVPALQARGDLGST